MSVNINSLDYFNKMNVQRIGASNQIEQNMYMMGAVSDIIVAFVPNNESATTLSLELNDFSEQNITRLDFNTTDFNTFQIAESSDSFTPFVYLTEFTINNFYNKSALDSITPKVISKLNLKQDKDLIRAITSIENSDKNYLQNTNEISSSGEVGQQLFESIQDMYNNLEMTTLTYALPLSIVMVISGVKTNTAYKSFYLKSAGNNKYVDEMIIEKMPSITNVVRVPYNNGEESIVMFIKYAFIVPNAGYGTAVTTYEIKGGISQGLIWSIGNTGFIFTKKNINMPVFAKTLFTYDVGGVQRNAKSKA